MDKPQTETASKKYKILRIVVNVIVYAFFALCILLLVVAIVSKRSEDGATNLFGREARLVLTESMAKSDKDVSGFKVKSIPKGSMVFIKKVPEPKMDEQGNVLNQDEIDEWYSTLKVGDVLTFRYNSFGDEYYRNPITHRIVEISEAAQGGYYIVLEGDNGNGSNNLGMQFIYTDEDYSLSIGKLGDRVIGKVTGQSRLLGFAASSMKRPLGIALIVIVPCAIIIVMESIRIGSIFSARKKEKLAQETQEKSNKIEELERKLAELQNGTAPNDDAKT